MEEKNDNGNKKAGVPTNLEPVGPYELTRWVNGDKISYTITTRYISHNQHFTKTLSVFPREVDNLLKVVDQIRKDIVSSGFKA